MANDEKLTPEEADVRNQAMLHDLRSMHTPVATAQSLERMRERLLTAERTSAINSMQTSGQFMPKTQQGRIQSMHDIQIPMARKKGRYLTMLIAGIMATFLVGSLLFVVEHVYYNNTGNGEPVIPQVPPIKKATATPEPTFSDGPGWKLVATYRGTGSTTITKLHLKFPYVVESFYSCTGKGDIYVKYNAGTIGFGTSCSSLVKGEVIQWYGKNYVLEVISIVADKDSSWKLQLENCVDQSRCPSPAHTATPTSDPTVMPSPMPTPMPTPMPAPSEVVPTPTLSPGSYPTPMPTPSPTP